MEAMHCSTVLLPEPFSPTTAIMGYFSSSLSFCQPRRPLISIQSNLLGQPEPVAQRAVRRFISLLSGIHASKEQNLSPRGDAQRIVSRGDKQTIAQN